MNKARLFSVNLSVSFDKIPIMIKPPKNVHHIGNKTPAKVTSKIRTAPRTLSKEAQRLWKAVLNEYELDDAVGYTLLQTALEAFDRSSTTAATPGYRESRVVLGDLVDPRLAAPPGGTQAARAFPDGKEQDRHSKGGILGSWIMVGGAAIGPVFDARPGVAFQRILGAGL